MATHSNIGKLSGSVASLGTLGVNYSNKADAETWLFCLFDYIAESSMGRGRRFRMWTKLIPALSVPKQLLTRNGCVMFLVTLNVRYIRENDIL